MRRGRLIEKRTAEALTAGLSRFGIAFRVSLNDSRLNYAAVNLAANFEVAKRAADLAAARDHLVVCVKQIASYSV
jgi:hypothetical protein